MSVHSTKTFFQAQTKIVQTIYSKTAPQKPLRYPELFNSGGSYAGEYDRQFFQALSIVGFGLLGERKEGQTPEIDAAKEGVLQMFPYVTYALRYIVTKEAAREDPKKLIPKLPPLLKYSSDQTKEYLFWNILNLGFLGAGSGGFNVYDGNPLFYNAHTISGASATGVTTYSNLLGSVALTVETLNLAQTLAANIPDDRGLTTSRTLTDLWYPVGLHQTVVEVLSSFYYPSDSSNRVNSAAGSVKPHAIEYITAASGGPYPWFVTGPKGELGADAHTLFASIKWDENRAFTDDNTLSMIHETEFRASWGAFDGRGAIGSQGA